MLKEDRTRLPIKYSRYLTSMRLAMNFIRRAWITDTENPKFFGFNHAYLTSEKRWNGAYTELGLQVIFNALIPYYKFSGELEWLRLAESILLEWIIPKMQNTDSESPLYGSLLEPYIYYQEKPSEWCDYDTFNVANGILAFLTVYSVTYNETILERTYLLSSFLDRMTNPDHSIKMGFKVREGKLDDRTPISSAGYAAWAYSYWYNLTGEEEYRERAENYCDWILSIQKSNGWLSMRDIEVAESMIYGLEGLYWTGEYCHRMDFIKRAKISLDAFIMAEKNGPGNLYLLYRSDWAPHPSKQIDLLSTCGRYAKLCYKFYNLTGDEKYKDEYLKALTFLYEMQDKSSSDPNVLGSIPRATNLPYFRSVCPCYTYVGAILIGIELLKSI